MVFPAVDFFYLALQGFELPSVQFPYLGTRGLIAIVMLIHIFFAELFIGYVLGSPALQLWSRRTGNPWMERLAHSMARFNILTFSVGATWAVMFLVLLLGFYPRVSTAIFTHFFWFWPVIGMGTLFLTVWLFYFHYYRAKNRARTANIVAGFAAAFFIYIWMEILTGIDTFMVTGGGVAGQVGPSPNTIGSALDSILNPMFYWMALHRIFGNLSWPAYAIAAWAAFSYRRAKSAEDKAFYDWAGSMGVTWGTIFLLLQPIIGFLNMYSLKGLNYQPGNLSIPGAGGPYERLTGTGVEANSFTSHMLLVNLVMIVALFVLSNIAMYMGAQRHPERAGRRPIQVFGLVATVAGLYSISPISDWPFLYARYIMIGIMILATLGTLVAYIRGRRQFSYGSPSGGYRAVLLALGTLAAVITLGMGWMKSDSRSPYTIYGDPSYTVQSEQPVSPDQLHPTGP